MSLYSEFKAYLVSIMNWQKKTDPELAAIKTAVDSLQGFVSSAFVHQIKDLLDFREEVQNLFAVVSADLDGQRKILEAVLAAVTPSPTVSGFMVFEFGGKQGDRMKVAVNEQGTVTVTLKNKDGGPGAIDGIPVFSAVPDGVLELTQPTAEVSPGVWNCGIKTPVSLPAGTPAVGVVVTFTGDEDLGDGTKPIILTGSLTVFDPAQEATVGDLTFSAFTPATPPTPPQA